MTSEQSVSAGAPEQSFSIEMGSLPLEQNSEVKMAEA